MKMFSGATFNCYTIVLVIADHQIAVEKFPGPVMKTNKNKIFISDCGVEQNALQRNLSKLVSDSDFQQTCLKL